jgi:hypothetical protein
MRHNGKTAVSFEEAVRRHHQMSDCSRYAFHVSEWQARFGRGDVLIVLNDDLIAEPQNYLDQITNFIGIPRVTLEASKTARGGENIIAVAPRSPRLARNARRFRFWLGSHQFYRTRRFLNRIGVWRVCFEGGEPFPPLDPGTRSRLQDLLTPEVDRLEQLLERDLSQWKGRLA